MVHMSRVCNPGAMIQGKEYAFVTRDSYIYMFKFLGFQSTYERGSFVDTHLMNYVPFSDVAGEEDAVMRINTKTGSDSYRISFLFYEDIKVFRSYGLDKLIWGKPASNDIKELL